MKIWNGGQCDDPRGLLIGAGGVKVENAGIVVQGGASVVGGLMLEHPFTGGRTKGVTIATGGLDIRNGGLTVNEKGLTVGREMNVHDTGLAVTEGMTVSRNGLKIVTGGLSVPEDGLTVGQGLNLVGTEGLYVTASDVVVHAGGMQTGAQTSARPDGAVIVGTGCEVEEVGVEVVFGKTNIHQGGLKVTNGMTVNRKGVSVTGGLTVADEGIKSGSLQLDYSIVGGLKVVDGLEYYYGTEGPWGTPKSMHIAKGGMTVEDTGLTVKGGFTIGDDTVTLLFNPGFKIDGGVSVVGGMKLKSNTAISNRENKMLIKDLGLETPKASLGGGVTLVSGLTVYDVGVKIDGIGGASALNVQSGGMKVTGGLTVSHSNGMLVKTGGVSVEDSGVSFYHPETWSSARMHGVDGGLVVDDGPVDEVAVEIKSLGLRVTAGLTIGSGGMVVSSVSAGGPENGYKNVHDVDGMYVTGGGTALLGVGVFSRRDNNDLDPDSKFTIEDGLVVAAGGMRLEGTQTTRGALGWPANNMNIAGGVTIETAGVVASAATVSSDGATVTGGMTVQSGGMRVSGADLGGVNHRVVKDGVSVDSLSISSSGLVVDSIVDTGHLYISDGLTVSDKGMTVNNREWGHYAVRVVGENNDGATVKLGGVEVIGGASTSGGLKVWNEGITTKGTLSVAAEGIISNHGVEIITGGLTAVHWMESILTSYDDEKGTHHVWSPTKPHTTDAHIALSGGLKVTGGVSVMSHGIMSKKGITSPDDLKGGSVAGGIRITDGGIDMDVGGSMNIQEGGFVVKGGVVLDKGLNSAKKMQVNGGLMVTSGDVTITDGGLVIDSIDEPSGERGLTVGTTDSTTNIDLVVSQGGLTVSAGTIKYSGTLTTTSDRRLKENIVLIKSDDAREAVKQLKGVFYDWNSDHTHSQRILNGLQSARNASATFKELPTRRTGLIAQDVQKVLPHVVTRLNTTEKASEQEDDPLLGIAYQDVIPYLVSAIQGMDEWVQSEQQQQMQSAQDLARLAVKDLEATLERAEKRSQALYQRASL